MTTAYIGFGANLGQGSQTFHEVCQRLQSLAVDGAACASELFTTHPVGGPPDQPCYSNACIALETCLDPADLLAGLQTIEQEFGRVRNEHWGPRTIDLDLLFHGDAIVDAPDLAVPHPRLHLRRFVLDPLCELAADLVHPLLRLTIGQLAEAMRNPQANCLAMFGRNDALADAIETKLVGKDGFGECRCILPESLTLEPIRHGGRIIGIRWPESLGSPPAWIIVAQQPQAPSVREGEGTIVPAVDCHGADALAELGYFADGLRPPRA